MTKREKFDNIFNDFLNGNITDATKEVKNLNRHDRYELIVYLGYLGYEEITEKVIKMCVRGDF